MFVWQSWWGVAAAAGIALIAALVVIVIVSVSFRMAARRSDWPGALAGSARHPFRALVVLVAVWPAVAATLPDETARGFIDQTFRIAVIAAATWLVAALLAFVIGLGQARYRIDVPNNKVARRMQTQLALVRRLAIAVVVIVGVASILLTFPGVQGVGASVLASAGVVSIVAGLAAQSVLGNVFAGIQLAFSDAIRVDDVVIVEGEWGRIEEITLTYVVVGIWDDRRMVLPSTYFTSTPFQNWTRNTSELLGSVEFDLDWWVSPAVMRTELERILDRTDLWDGRAQVLQVTDAVGGYVRIRILVTAVDAPTLFDLRCLVREQMVEWILAQNPSAIPRNRVQMVEQEPRPVPKRGGPVTEPVGLFSGSAEAEQRASLFTSSITLPDLDDEPER
ncbi:mechanosensitive ion channel family protein [Plantibacter sp. VKM Ac-2876]|uniref:mechanosensitive ion channel family protein n=1 Tax=Plantibacter sp. VKM Ac-2876 TaxID=2783826 RepID=UPI00188B35FC|nr:mechanosensitive ion channel domain-containing protein [Plantibacter sp. VKM Ac-2876]MBF4565638.1 mechanosensitive ion channel [Plantibacter sp. VKM Ac-2876]